MSKILRGLRGATTASANTRDAILDATEELIRALQEANGFKPEDVESAIFTSSPDLTAEYPARAARGVGHRSAARRQRSRRTRRRAALHPPAAAPLHRQAARRAETYVSPR